MTEQTTERTAPRKRMLSGIKPSGDLTLGSYLGAIRNWRDRAEEFDCYYFMADLHAITVRQNPADLRRRTMEQLAQYIACGLDLPGYAIGGLAVGESTQTMYDIIDAVESYMPKDKTRYLMGVGTPSNIIEGVARGVDFFDCVMPARNARHAKLFTWEGAINLKNAKYERDMQPIDPACDCPVCRRYSRAYLRHLFKAEEMLAMRLSVMHNLYFYNKLMERIRQALDEGRFEEFRRTYSERLDRRI